MEGQNKERSVTVNIKAIAALVIVSSIALLVFENIHRRREAEADAIPQVTRGPLKPMTPPLTANKLALLADLKARHFDALQHQLDAYQEQAERDTAEEANVRLALETFASDDPALGPRLVEWVKKSPNSWAAHLAHAEFLFARGWDARGNGWASETSKDQFAGMRALFASGAKEAKAALALNPKLSQAYALLVQQQRAERGLRDCLEAGVAGLKKVPASFDIRVEMMVCLEPRWGGSEAAMARFAQASQAYVHQNPRLAVLKGFPYMDRGDYFFNHKEYGQAIRFYTLAIRKGGDHAGFYRSRAEAFIRVDRFHDALEDLRRADRLWPQYSGTIRWLAYVLADENRNQAALKEIAMDVEIAGPNQFDVALRRSILMRLRGGAAGGMTAKTSAGG